MRKYQDDDIDDKVDYGRDIDSRQSAGTGALHERVPECLSGIAGEDVQEQHYDRGDKIQNGDNPAGPPKCVAGAPWHEEALPLEDYGGFDQGHRDEINKDAVIERLEIDSQM